MNVSDIADFPGKSNWLKIADLENMFEVYLDKKAKYMYNLNETLCFVGNNSELSMYKIDHDMFWPLVSYKLYNTTRYAWLLMKLNNVDGDHIFDILKAGTVVKYIEESNLSRILGIINNE